MTKEEIKNIFDEKVRKFLKFLYKDLEVNTKQSSSKRLNLTLLFRHSISFLKSFRKQEMACMLQQKV